MTSLPTPRPAKVIGILNIVLGSVLLLYHLMGIVQAALTPFTAKMMEGVQQATERKAAAEHAARVDEARRRETSATGPAERLRFEAERKAIENAAPMPAVDMTAGVKMMADPRMAAYAWSTYLTGLVAYGAMLASGIGLLKPRAWARTLALWDSALNLLRIALLTAVAVVVIAPVMSKSVGQQIAAQQAAVQRAGGKAPPAGMPDLGRLMGVMMAVAYAGMGLVAAVYPTVTLFVLGRKGVRAACDLGPVAAPELP